PRQGAVLLSGDAGIGKTRVLRELAARAVEDGQRVLVGHCLDLGESAFPFQPFVEVLGRLTEDERAEVAHRFHALAPLLPGGPRSDPGSGSGELFADLVAALDWLAGDGPVLLILEDVHWADASTRHLVRYVLNQRFAGPVHVVVSYRSDDLHRRHPLRTAVAEWARLPGVQRLDLGPLDDDEVRDLVRSRSSDAPGASGLAAIVRRAEGNAFIVEELIDAGADDGNPLPETLADLLLVRLDRLDDLGRQVVRAASCAGGPVTDELLAEVVGLDPSELDVALRSALDHKILTRASDDSYTFRHALLAEVVYDDLLPGERRRIHLAYLAALTKDGFVARASEIANHALEAGDLPAAFVAKIEAGEQAVRVHGYDEAADCYERALEIIDAAPEGTDVIGLVIRASEALTAAGHMQRATALVRDNLRHLPADATAQDRGRLLVELGTAAFAAAMTLDAEAASLEALELTAEEPTELRALAEALYANIASDARRDDEAFAWAAQARSLGQRLGLPHVVADATAVQARLQSRSGDDPDEAKRRFAELIESTRAGGNVVGELRAHILLAFFLYDRGELDKAEESFLEAMKRAADAGRSWAPYGFDGRVFASVTAYLRGRWDRVTELGKVGKLSPPPLAAATLEAVGVMVSAGRGDASALETIERLKPLWSQDIVLAIYAGTAAIDLAPNVSAAIAWHDALLESLTEDWDSPLAPARIRMGGLILGRLAAAAPTATAAEREEFDGIATRVMEGVERTIGVRGQFGPEGQAWLARANAEALRFRWLTGNGDIDLGTLTGPWREAVEGFAALGNVYEEARSTARLAAVLQASGDSGEAQRLLVDAVDTASRLGAKPLIDEIDAIGATGVSRRDHAFDELTPREVEVLGQLIAGHTNGEIAKLLFISPKTVSVHVSNILAKLGASTRTEAAAIARRQGLLEA
ncbi:MAG: AAA family ATPase, partial [Aeromicrobium sp.]